MKLNIDCVRDLLIECEKLPYESTPSLDTFFKFELLAKYSPEEISYSMEKLYEAGFINFRTLRVWGGPKFDGTFQDITWLGHEFLNKIRNDNIWNKTKEKVSETVGSASLEILGAVAGSITTRLLGL